MKLSRLSFQPSVHRRLEWVIAPTADDEISGLETENSYWLPGSDYYCMQGDLIVKGYVHKHFVEQR